MTEGCVARWTCPECGSRASSFGASQGAADGGLQAVVREHLEAAHPGATEVANPATQAAGWLAGTGELVELWGGPFDGATVWCPPGDLPPVIGLHRTPSGAIVPTRSALVRLLPHVESYRRGEMARRDLGHTVRYLHDSRPPWTALEGPQC